MDKNHAPLLERSRLALAEGKLDAALKVASEVLSEEPNSILALYLIGVIYERMGNAGEAINHFKQIVRLDKSHDETLNWLCVLFRRTGEYDNAIACGRRLCDIRPTFAEGQINLALCYIAKLQYQPAIEYLFRAIELKPDSPEAWHNLGVAQERLLQFSEAEKSYSKAIELNPENPHSYVSMAGLLRRSLRVEESKSYLEIARNMVGDNPLALAQLGQALLQDGDLESAVSTLEESLRLDPEDVEITVDLGHALQQVGQFDRAVNLFHHVLDKSPHHPQALFELSQAQRVDTHSGPELLKAISSSLKSSSLTHVDRKNLHYGAGKVLDDLGQYEEAFHHFREANQLAYEELGENKLNRSNLAAGIDQMIQVFTTEFLAQNHGKVSNSTRPILIVGLVRSGTTLVEQILSRHPNIGAGGEQNFLLQNGGVLHPTLGLDMSKAQSTAEGYLKLLTSLAPDRDYTTDKMPNNYFMLGTVCCLFSKAQIIHCQRNLADTATSIFTTPFRQSLNFAHRQDDIVFTIHQYSKLMDHWSNVLPANQFHEVQYESLVLDFEPTVRKMINDLEITWDEACLKHNSGGGAVVTPSNWQVRQPIYNRSIRRFENYRKWLPEFKSLT